MLAQMVAKGATIHHFTLEDTFDLKEFQKNHGKEAVPLFGIDPNNQAHCFSTDNPLPMNEDWKILYLGYDSNVSSDE